MSQSDPNVDRVLNLTEAACDDVASRNDLAELDALLLADRRARHEYEEYYRMHVALRLQLRANRVAEKVQQHLDNASAMAVSDDWNRTTAHTPTALPLTFPSNTVDGSNGLFSAGWPIAYLVATVVFGIALSIAAIVHVSNPTTIVKQRLPRPSARAEIRTAVGRITGSVDCEWEGSGFRGQGSEAANQKSEIISDKSVIHLGDRMGLKSGLLEITYDTGAVVILQGPVTYEVESPVGGYLSVGRLTARLEKKSEVGGQRSEIRGQRSEIRGQRSEIRGQRSEIRGQRSEIRGQRSEVGGQRAESDNQQFAIRTPTALVTDLGTEFGVEVDLQGVTKSHVFRGLVRVQAVAPDGRVRDDGRLLHENESARVERGARGTVLVVPMAEAIEFIHQVPKPSITSLDLVDVVAGGDGFSGKRNRGIDPTTGRTADQQPVPRGLTGDHQYHRVESLPLVDGVFVPDGGNGPVQIDSAGNTFDGFDKTDNSSCGHIWAAGRVTFADSDEVFGTELGGVEYGASGHGAIFMHANKGITFDLEAIRRANPGRKLVRFRTTAGNTEIESEGGRSIFADLWVLVDGQVRFRRREVCSFNGAMPIDIALADGNRFLTLVSTDGGNTSLADWIMFGDPRLELLDSTQARTDP